MTFFMRPPPYVLSSLFVRPIVFLYCIIGSGVLQPVTDISERVFPLSVLDRSGGFWYNEKNSRSRAGTRERIRAK